VGNDEVIIIGAGPAGIASAIQLKRYRVKFTLLEQKEIGGLLINAHRVENYPGFPEGISGPELVERFRNHLKNAGVEVRSEKVEEMEYGEKQFIIKTDRGMLSSTIAIIATGTQPKELSIPTISENIKERVFYEVHPIRGVGKKIIAVVGGGDAAFDYALNLSLNNKVIILNRSERARCTPVLWERAMRIKNISYLDNISVKEISDHQHKVLLRCKKSDLQKTTRVEADYVIVAVGRKPRLEFLGSELKMNYNALAQAKKLYLIGDVKNETYRQTAICVGDGVRTAMEIYETIGRKSE